MKIQDELRQWSSSTLDDHHCEAGFKAADRIDELEEALRVTASELASFISAANADEKSKISSFDMDEPEYFDYQTIHEAEKLLIGED